jgi:hypothetical protein
VHETLILAGCSVLSVRHQPMTIPIIKLVECLPKRFEYKKRLDNSEDAFGLAFEAYDSVSKQFVAIKLFNDQQDLAAAQNEASCLTRVNIQQAKQKRDHVVGIECFGELAAAPPVGWLNFYIAFELCDRSLTKELQERVSGSELKYLSTPEALDWARQLCAGLCDISAAGISHQRHRLAQRVRDPQPLRHTSGSQSTSGSNRSAAP